MQGLLMRAMERKEKVEMIYLSANGELTQRVIDVVNLNDQHVIAYCYTRKERRLFKLDNILSLSNKVRRFAQ
ncbi:WYL domain-containing protein [Alkalihalophilus lindianensis]|uniref:WYL domain-containing protein n=1 Tax=Alkalihalophilus lindianensis TaxID=1630542 RepID=A0ABU3X544_9BACI|nr:WYL domain-containing protein [Alkalihalophilus lindianensis]MDV2683017.1 WYL domain-containing protein [Alkalihalophilus lindianensis]